MISREGRSGTVLGFVDEEGERALYVDPGVNDLVDFEETNPEYFAGSRFLHLTSFVGEKPFEAQIKIAQTLTNMKVTLDPGEIYAKMGWTKLKPLVERCFAVLPNENELRLLTGKDYKQGAKQLIDIGVNIVAVKLGSRGCYATDGEEEYLIEPFKVKVIDTTGAGDAFCAGFLYGLVEGKPLRQCAVLGNFVASGCIVKIGAREGLPRLEDVPREIRN